ncbi:MAG: DUF2778 domain-containing protein [Pseudomonas sp.]|nr:DUF2778 domain-containing protein [Pseudomonas sp.]
MGGSKMQEPLCTFILNSKPISSLKCNSNLSYEAFSGLTGFTNLPIHVGVRNAGPLPMGQYYIVDRQSGGRLGWLRDNLKDLVNDTEREQWFALYRDDGVIDDFTSINQIRRGNFRLHPAGATGVSEGCVTLVSTAGFEELRKFLKSRPKQLIPGTGIKHYGVLEVK